MEETLFYALGIGLVLAALLLSAVGLRSTTFPSKPLMALGVVAFVLLVGATMAAAVINARDEQEKRRAELAHEAGAAEEPAGGGAKAEKAAGGETKLALAAPEDGTFAYDKDSLEAAAGDLTIEFDNPALVQHDVVIEHDGEEIAKSDLVSEGSTSVTAELEPGEYIYFCDVPGHREGGMEGSLTVQ
jgi:plastocyanin